MFVFAAHFLSIPNALIIGIGILSVSFAMSKFCIDLCVCAAQSLSAATFIGPNVSRSSLNSTYFLSPCLSIDIFQLSNTKIIKITKI